MVPIGLGLAYAGWYAWGEYHLRAAHKALERHELAVARSHLADYLKTWPNNAEVHLLAARTARRARDYDEAARLRSRYRQLGGGAEYLQLEWAMERVQRGELAGQENVLWALVNEENEDAPLALEALAQGYAHMFRWNEAVDCLNRLEKYWPNDAEVFLMRGWAQESLRRSEPAASDFARALELKPDDIDAHLHLGEVLLSSNKAAEAVTHLERGRQARPNDLTVLRNLARCYVELQRDEDSEAILKQLKAVNDREVLVPVLRGIGALNRDQLTEAENHLREALKLAPRDREANRCLMDCLQRQGRVKEAAVYAEHVREAETDQLRFSRMLDEIAEQPTNWPLRCEAAEILFRNGQAEDGVRMLKSVLRAMPHHAQANQALADYYSRSGDKALAEYHRRQIQ
jgi:predicted Zn-dependent protease